MSSEAFEHYLDDRSALGAPEPRTAAGSAGGAACGDRIEISLRIEDGRIASLRRSAEGCGAARAASAAVAALAGNADLAVAALIDAERIDAELGGLSAVGAHAAELAAEALHRALGGAVMSGDDLLAPPLAGTERVLVALSGGVDSAVAALRERERGAEVFAVTLELWRDPANDGERSCCSASAVRSARSLAHSLGIPHLTVDLRDRFRAGVVDPFLAGYAAGTTPNPCVRCNGQVRLDPMIDLARRLGASALATGHYARLTGDGEGPLLRRAVDPAKDQTYMLAGLAPASLARMRFPLGELTKPEVRALAQERGLEVAGKPESQDLCFLAGEGKRGFLARHGGLRERPGEIVDRAGRRLGRHRGHHEFTIGQRRGIGVAADEPLFVLATDATTNRVVVGTAAELATRRVAVRDAVLHRDGARVDSVMLRYHSAMIDCSLTNGAGRPPAAGAFPALSLQLDEPVRSTAPGQTAVFFERDRVVGHGTIA